MDDRIDSGVPDAELLGRFVEATLGDDAEQLQHARASVRTALGPEALVDVAGAVASFNAVVQVADGSGIVVEDFKVELISHMPEQLGRKLGPPRRP